MRALTHSIILSAAISGLATPHASMASPAFPTRQITVVVPLTAGGPVDLLARLVAEKMAADLKQQVIVENRPGAGANIGTEHVARAQPDGYTILCTTDSPMTINPALYRHLNFSPVNDLTPVSLATTFAQMLVVNPALPVRTLEEFLAMAKTKPLTIASGGNGSPGHLTAAYFSEKAGIKLTHVPYKGNSQAVGDLLGGQVNAGFLATPGVLPHVKAGKLRALGVSSSTRSVLAPDVPTISEAGAPGFEANFAMVYMVPAGTPPDVVATLSQAISRALRSQDVHARLAAMDITPVGGNPAQAAEYLEKYRKLWGTQVEKLQLQVD